MKNIVLLGASGSIGTQSLDVIYQHQDLYNLIGISVHTNVKAANTIIKHFPNLKYINVKDEAIKAQLVGVEHCEVSVGAQGLAKLAQTSVADFVINAVIGFAGLIPSVSAIKAGKVLGLANKETLVCAGDIIMPMVEKYNATLIPIDSEHSAIFQCLVGSDYRDIKQLILTASGGSFRDKTKAQLQDVTLEQTLSHPTWNMGVGITIDSATMFNKALEIIEAHHLFNVDYDQIKVLIHPQSIDHSMVEFIDGAVLAQLSFPDMRIPISYALSYPRRSSLVPTKSIMKMDVMSFHEPDLERFSALKVAYEVGKAGGTYPTVLNASKEIANRLFVDGLIKFMDIEAIIVAALKAHQSITSPTLEDIFRVDQITREWVKRYWSEV